MSKEIEFRAWDKKTNNMYFVASIDMFGKVVTLLDDRGDTLDFIERAIHNVELMQFTGLLDKNGVEIYEGDIVDDYYFKNSVSRHKVYWADSYGCWSTINLKDPIVDRKQLGYFNEAKDLHRNEYLEVIGNIYENSNLLERTKYESN